MKTIARDEKGNEFVKDVKIISFPNTFGRRLVDFGFPARYYLDDLMRDYPFKRNLCIDGGGRNHKGSPVWVAKEDVNRILSTGLENKSKVNPEP